MKIYLDYIFLENLVVNTVVIIETIIFTNSHISKKRRNLIIILDTFISCLINIIPQINNCFFYIIFSSITLLILFRFKNFYEYMKKISCYYLIYFLYIGIIIAFSIIFKINLEKILFKIIAYILSGLLLHFLVKDMWKMWKTKIRYRDLYYTLKINNVEINSFVDTGNTVKDPISNLNVIFLNNELKDKINLNEYNKVEIEVLTVNGNNIKEGYIVKNVLVIKDGKKIANIPEIILCFSLIGNTPEKYSAIIGYDTYLENLNGGVNY